MADICQFVCPYRNPISGYCGSTGGYATCPHRKMYEPPTIKSAEPIKPMTNADKYFRNATDEELAEYLSERSTAPSCTGRCHKDYEVYGELRTFCHDCWLDWLKQEVESDETNGART